MEIVHRLWQCLTDFTSPGSASVDFALVAFVVGSWAAITWWMASIVKTDPSKSGLQLANPGTFQPGESPDPELSQDEQIVTNMITLEAIMAAARKSVVLNKWAAGLTAVAVLFSMLSSVLGALAGCPR